MAMIATSAMASLAAAGDLPAIHAIASGSRPEHASAPASQLKFSGASAFERWNLTASASRKAWDPTDLMPAPRFDWRDVLGGESTRASLAFDWQRNLDTSRIEAAAYARRSGVDLHSGLARLDASSCGERFEQHDRRSLIGAALRWTGDGSVGVLAASHSASVRLRTETLDVDGALRMPGGNATDTVRRDRLRQAGATLSLDSAIQLAERLRSVASVRYDSYRFGVDSDLAGHEGSGAGALASPRLCVIADLAGSEMFVTAARGYASDDPRSPGAATDPRTGAPIGRLDPLATVTTAEAGLRGRFLPGVETTLSMFRARSGAELMLTGESGTAEILRPSMRQGVQLSARYAPTSWLNFELQAAALRARFADGAGEHIAGAAERTVSAATSLRIRRGWTASLVVNSLGRRDSPNEGTRVKPSTFVNARLTRNLSKTTRLSLDVFNVFDRRVSDVDYFSAARLWSNPGAADSFLFNPAEPRGFRLKLRTHF